MHNPHTTPVTTAARRLVRQHNDERLVSGYIYLVDLATGDIVEPVASYAATQIAAGHELYGKYALIRVGHGKLSQARAQEFLDCKGKGVVAPTKELQPKSLAATV